MLVSFAVADVLFSFGPRRRNRVGPEPPTETVPEVEGEGKPVESPEAPAPVKEGEAAGKI